MTLCKKVEKPLKAEQPVEEENKFKHKQPELIKGGELRSYQLEGMNWLIQLFENGINGILADEMGLGKTVMTISFIAHLWTHGVKGPFLVVAPLSTLQNWMSEIKRWAPDLPSVLYHGPKANRDIIKRLLSSTGAKKRKLDEELSLSLGEGEMPIVVTSYEIAINDRKFLQKHHWKYLIVDEGHRLKNFNCRLIQELRVLRTDNRLLLTGTPLQNNLTELWSLLNFILPDVFDNLENFQSWFDFNEVVDENKDNPITEDQVAGQLVEKLHAILQPFLLRRLKVDLGKHLEIPTKKQVVVYSPFTDVQREFYNSLKEYGTEIFTNARGRLQNLLMQLRKACNHPFLFDADFDEFHAKYEERQKGKDLHQNGHIKSHVEEIKEELTENEDVEDLFEEDEAVNVRKRSLSAFQIFCNEERTKRKKRKSSGNKILTELSNIWSNLAPEKKKMYEEKAEEDKREFLIMQQKQRLKDDPKLLISDPQEYLRALRKCSGKLDLLDRMLPILKKDGHKCLIFSQMTRMLDILEDYLELSGYKYCRIDGSIPREERQNMIDRFNNDESYFCFLLSTRAGGLGINLTSADTVIIYDSDWNPQMDLQAQDRCHRIGQTKPVVVFRLITANSIESKILKKANAKLKLERLVIHKERFKGTGSKIISEKDMMEILKTDGVDDVLGGDVVISDEELLKVLNRDDCIKMFDKKENEFSGFELLEDQTDGQGGLVLDKTEQQSEDSNQ